MQTIAPASTPASAAAASMAMAPSMQRAAELLDQVARYVRMLGAALADSPEFYARLVQRGFLLSAIDHASVASELTDLQAGATSTILERLTGARVMGSAASAELVQALQLAQVEAVAAAHAIRTQLEQLELSEH